MPLASDSIVCDNRGRLSIKGQKTGRFVLQRPGVVFDQARGEVLHASYFGYKCKTRR